MSIRRVLLGIPAAAVIGLLAWPHGGAHALDPRKDEKARLKSCEKSLCTLVTRKSPSRGDLACALTKTWGKKLIKEGSSSKKISWGFGDARCAVDIKIPRSTIIAALSEPERTLDLPHHEVQCEVERSGSVDKVHIALAPRIHFKNGRAKKAWINLKKVEGPSAIKGLVWTVAQLEDSVGIFHRDLIKALNKLLVETCPDVAAGGPQSHKPEKQAKSAKK